MLWYAMPALLSCCFFSGGVLFCGHPNCRAFKRGLGRNEKGAGQVLWLRLRLWSCLSSLIYVANQAFCLRLHSVLLRVPRSVDLLPIRSVNKVANGFGATPAKFMSSTWLYIIPFGVFRISRLLGFKWVQWSSACSHEADYPKSSMLPIYSRHSFGQLLIG